MTRFKSETEPPFHVTVQAGVENARVLRSRAFHSAIAVAASFVGALLRADERARVRHELRYLTDAQLKDVGLTPKDVGRVRFSQYTLPF